MKASDIKISKPVLARHEIEFFRAYHVKCMADSVYKEGFESKSPDNPYVFPEVLNNDLLLISMKAGLLTEQEKEDLRKLNDEFGATEWSRWSKGHYRKVNLGNEC
jgi:hypothetical protein